LSPPMMSYNPILTLYQLYAYKSILKSRAAFPE
jgi:hypothetical protein